MTTNQSLLSHKLCNSFRTVTLGLLLCSTSAWALTAANTLIKNQASATFRDESGQQYSVTSNMVETLVQQVAGVELVQDQGKRANIGGTVHFPHVLTNVGNGDDQFDLSSNDVAAGDDFDFGGGNITFYADLNQDGQPDDLTSPITTTPLLAADESFAFVAVAVVPGTTNDGEQGQFTLTAQSDFTNTVTATNTDTVDITNQAIIDVRKAMSATAGLAGSGNYTVTLSYQNTSSIAATNVVLIDALPTGMNYVDNSGLWSETDATVLTDTDGADSQPAGSSAIIYCAYDASCTVTDQVTATIDQVAAGAKGQLTFEVSIDSSLTESELINTGEYEYHDGSSTVPTAPTNQVIFKVISSPGVVTNGSNSDPTDGIAEPITVASVSQGGTAIFTDYVWNAGNGSDSFDLTLGSSNFPVGTALLLFKADGSTPLLDTNGNGIPDTGNLDPDESRAIVIKAILPPSATGSDYEVTLTATSFADESLSNPARNVLTTVTNASVDLTNDAALGDSGVKGNNPGPEGSPVNTNPAVPGTTTRFTLYVNNTSSSHDNYDLAASTDSSFAALNLPAGWAVEFVDENGYVLTNTGNIPGGSSKLIYADVSIPAGEEVSTAPISLYFRSLSPNSSASDIKHDAVTISEVTDLILEPNNQGQVLPGGIIIYSHWLTNQGNGTKTDIVMTQTNNADGWSSELYADTDDDGVLSSGDTRLGTVSSLTAGESQLIFAKVYAPASAPMGTDNLTTITASWDSGASSTTAEDLTTTNRSDVKISKTQALDADCNGAADSLTFDLSNFDVAPGECVVYQLTAINTGAETMHNVRIQDATPAFTHFITAGGLPSLSQGSLAAPVTNGSDGEVIGNMGSLPAGSSATLTFGIGIE